MMGDEGSNMFINFKNHEFDDRGHKLEFFVLRPWDFYIESPWIGTLRGHLNNVSSKGPFYERRNEVNGVNIWIGRWEYMFRRPQWAQRRTVETPHAQA